MSLWLIAFGTVYLAAWFMWTFRSRSKEKLYTLRDVYRIVVISLLLGATFLSVLEAISIHLQYAYN